MRSSLTEPVAQPVQMQHRFPSAVQKVRNGTLAGIAQNVVSILNSLLLVRLVLSHFTPEDSGTWLLFLSIGAYVSFLDFGIAANISREAAFLRHIDVAEARARLHSLVVAARRVIVPIVVLSLALLLGFGFAYLPQTDVPHLTATLTAWAIFACGAVLSIVASTLFAVVFGAGNLVADKLGRAATQLIGLSGMVFVVLLAPDLRSLAGIWVIQNALLAVYAYAQYRRLDMGAPAIPVHVSTYQQGLFRTMPYWAAVGAGNVLYFNLGSSVLALRSSVSVVPHFDIPWRLVSIALAVISVYVSTSAPQLSGAYAAGAFHRMRTILFAVARNAMWLATGAALLLIWVGPELISLWTAGRVNVNLLTCSLLAIILLLETHTRIHMALIGAVGHFSVAITTVSLGALAVVGSWFLVPMFGTDGVLVALITALALTNGWFAPWYSFRRLDIHSAPYARTVAIPLIALPVLGTVLAGINFSKILPDRHSLIGVTEHLVLLGMLFAGCFLLFQRLFRVTQISTIAASEHHGE
jgi:O-antigen/teichoic acid export membrane protein